ncbi:hypothetical protein B0T16DRAFT_390312 [Cercophora newfieldiana]|uniref:Uncharacterized protein n=1 Tax=Cercophora newfieldiana TaxID=92897 RepID=A0AA40CPA5_9PEZI|nr:hypothetical protein B0T16DRAFT_390312 [Cercophora newfieldiana]
MAPFPHLPGSLLKPREGDVTAATSIDGGVTAGSPDTITSQRPWVIPVIVAGVLVIAVLTICAFVYINRRCEYGKARAQEPYLSRPEFDKRRKMSQAEKLEEEEKQRIIMIRKSLASRSWDGSAADSAASSRRVSQISSNQGQQHERPAIPEVSDEEDDEHEPKPLKDDWKAYEAEVMRETSLERHPAAETDTATTRPLLKQEVPGSPPR